jgi:hypothetical protein
MAAFTRTNGDSAQVAVFDTPAYVNGTTSGTVGQPVQPQGPKLVFITGDLGGDPTAQFGVGGAIEAVLKTVQLLMTVHMYQFNADGTYRIAAYDTGTEVATFGTDWDGGSLQDALQALGTVNGYSLAAATAAAGTLA